MPCFNVIPDNYNPVIWKAEARSIERYNFLESLQRNPGTIITKNGEVKCVTLWTDEVRQSKINTLYISNTVGEGLCTAAIIVGIVAIIFVVASSAYVAPIGWTFMGLIGISIIPMAFQIGVEKGFAEQAVVRMQKIFLEKDVGSLLPEIFIPEKIKTAEGFSLTDFYDKIREELTNCNHPRAIVSDLFEKLLRHHVGENVANSTPTEKLLQIVYAKYAARQTAAAPIAKQTAAAPIARPVRAYRAARSAPEYRAAMPLGESPPGGPLHQSRVESDSPYPAAIRPGVEGEAIA